MERTDRGQKELNHRIEIYGETYRKHLEKYNEYKVLKRKVVKTEQRMRAVALGIPIGLVALYLYLCKMIDFALSILLMCALMPIIIFVCFVILIILSQESCLHPVLYRKGRESVKSKDFQAGLKIDDLIKRGLVIPSEDDYRKAFFDSLGNVRSFCSITETVKSLHVKCCSYRSLDTMSDVVDCSITMKHNDGTFLRSMSGDSGPETEKELRVILPTNKDVQSVEDEIPDDIRKQFLYVQMFPGANINLSEANRWNFFVWNIQDPTLFRRRMNNVISRIVCLAASKTFERMYNEGSFKTYDVLDGETIEESIRRAFFTKEDIVPYFRLAEQADTDEEKTVNSDIEDIDAMFGNRNTEGLILPAQYHGN